VSYVRRRRGSTARRSSRGSGRGRRVRVRFSRKRKTHTQYKASSKSFKAKNVKIKKKRVAKISRKLKRAILQTVSSKRPIGRFTMKYANCGFGLDAFNTNTQAVFDGGDYGAFDAGWNFTVDHFANAASILFNGAKMVATNFTFNQPNFVGRFAQRGLLFTVKKSHIEYILANKSLRTIFIRVIRAALGLLCPLGLYHE